jgi:hypothetical protein
MDGIGEYKCELPWNTDIAVLSDGGAVQVGEKEKWLALSVDGDRPKTLEEFRWASIFVRGTSLRAGVFPYSDVATVLAGGPLDQL